MTVADYVLPLATAQGTTCTLGGKAASLAKLASGGCQVPDGFVVTTSAYEAFLNENDLRSGIRTVVAQANWVEPRAAASAANTIQSRLLRNSLPETVIDAVVAGYARLGANSPSVAIRSSATAEDLPEHSFAGQQDSFLNVNGTADVLRTIIKCYAS